MRHEGNKVLIQKRSDIFLDIIYPRMFACIGASLLTLQVRWWVVSEPVFKLCEIKLSPQQKKDH